MEDKMFSVLIGTIVIGFVGVGATIVGVGVAIWKKMDEMQKKEEQHRETESEERKREQIAAEFHARRPVTVSWNDTENWEKTWKARLLANRT